MKISDMRVKMPSATEIAYTIDHHSERDFDETLL